VLSVALFAAQPRRLVAPLPPLGTRVSHNSQHLALLAATITLLRAATTASITLSNCGHSLESVIAVISIVSIVLPAVLIVLRRLTVPRRLLPAGRLLLPLLLPLPLPLPPVLLR
jgi:hypothetical protein